MNPIILSTSGPYRRRCRCLWCHPRRGWRRRTRLGLLVVALFLASFLLVSGCSESTAGLPGEPDSQPTADAGADTRAGDLPEQRKVMVDAQQVADAMPGQEVGADTTPAPEVGPEVPPDTASSCNEVTSAGCSAPTAKCGITCSGTTPSLSCLEPGTKALGAACSGDSECGVGLVCSAPTGMARTCNKFCRVDGDCPSGTTCRSTVNVMCSVGTATAVAKVCA